MNNNKLIAYVHTSDLKTVGDKDIKSIDIINIAFGDVFDNLLRWREEDTKEQIKRFKAINPSIKFLLSVGGWSAGNFSEMASTEQTREIFAKSSLSTVKNAGLDGIDLDWEYPSYTVANIGGKKEDKHNFTLLLKEIRETFDKENKNYMLTIAAGGGEYYLKGVCMKEAIKYLDYVQLMTYDLRGGFQTLTGHHTPLFETDVDLFRASVDSAVKDFMADGVPKEKIVIGSAFYSRIWKGVPNVDNGLIQMAETVGTYGPGYGTLVEEYINKNGFKRYFDDTAKAPYLFDGSTFISYDDEESIAHKVKYLKEKGLYGIMYWEYCTDSTKTLTSFTRKELDK